MAGLFTDTSKTQTTQQNQSSGTTQGNLWGNAGLQNFLQGYNQQYAGAGGANVPINSWQTNAANAQPNVVGQLNPGFQAASGIAANGLSPTAYQPYMSQYTQAVVNPTMQSFNLMNNQALQGISGNQSANRSLGNSNNANRAGMYFAQALPQQQAAVAGLYDKAFNNAQGTAIQSQAQQLQAAAGLGGLAGAATGANQGAFGMGQNIWEDQYKNATLPYNLYAQGVQGYTGLGNLAGTNYSSQGTGSGTSETGTTPSPWKIGTGVASMFVKDGGRIMPPAFNNGGAVPSVVPSEASGMGDKINYFHRNFTDALRSQQQKPQGFGIGGDVGGWGATVTPDNGGPASGDAYWDGIQQQAQTNQVGQNLQSAAGKIAGTNISADAEAMAKANAQGFTNLQQGRQQLDAMNQKFLGVGGQQPRGFDEGGIVTPQGFGVDDNPPDLSTSPYAPFAPGSAMARTFGPTAFTPYGDGAQPASVAAPAPPPAPAYSGTTYGSPTYTPAPQAEAAPAKTGWTGFFNNIGGPNSVVGSLLRGEKWDATKASHLSRALAEISGPNVAGGLAKTVATVQQEQLDKLKAQMLYDQMTGLNSRTGKPTLAAQQAMGEVQGVKTVPSRDTALHEAKNPAEIARLEAQGEDAQIRIKSIEQLNTQFNQRMQMLDTMRIVANPNAPDYAQQIQQIDSAQNAARLTHAQELARLQAQGSSTPPPVVKQWSPEKGVH